MQYKIGDKVCYRPFDGCDDSLVENGKVKEIPTHTDKEIRVVYHCNNEWDKFMEYTSQLTPIDRLEMGWK